MRDLHAVLWLARSFGAKGLSGIAEKGWVPAIECRQVQEAYDFLLRLRTQLHVQSNAKNDLLTFSVQEEAAPALGYKASVAATAAEALMQEYFMKARTMHTFCRDFFEALEDSTSRRGWANRQPRIEKLGDGLALRDYQVLVLDGRWRGDSQSSRRPHAHFRAPVPVQLQPGAGGAGFCPEQAGRTGCVIPLLVRGAR